MTSIVEYKLINSATSFNCLKKKHKFKNYFVFAEISISRTLVDLNY